MATTKIEWCDKSWNIITGCSPVSEGCLHCYARQISYRLKGRYGYPKDDPFRVTFHPNRLEEPLHWKKPSRIFVVSMGDLFHEDMREDDIIKILCMADQASTWFQGSEHIFHFLTKRPQRMKAMVEKIFSVKPFHPERLFFGVSVENQRTADERIPILLQISAAKKFVSVEPMLSEINIEAFLPKRKISFYNIGGRGKSENIQIQKGVDWVICGGETGPKARSMTSDWARLLRDKCQAAGVPFFFKQMSGKQPIPKDLMIREFPQ